MCTLEVCTLLMRYLPKDPIITARLSWVVHKWNVQWRSFEVANKPFHDGQSAIYQTQPPKYTTVLAHTWQRVRSFMSSYNQNTSSYLGNPDKVSWEGTNIASYSPSMLVAEVSCLCIAHLPLDVAYLKGSQSTGAQGSKRFAIWRKCSLYSASRRHYFKLTVSQDLYSRQISHQTPTLFQERPNFHFSWNHDLWRVLVSFSPSIGTIVQFHSVAKVSL